MITRLKDKNNIQSLCLTKSRFSKFRKQPNMSHCNKLGNDMDDAQSEVNNA